jgi:uncharacterized repeat protein (TIGR01451 family)
MDAELKLSSATVPLDSATPLEGNIEIGHMDRGFSNDVVVTGTLPQGFSPNSIEIRPTIIAGEISWNTGEDTRLFTIDTDNGSTIDGLQVTLVGVPVEAEPCGIYGLDIHPNTGEYYALIGLQLPDEDCEYQAVRDLFKVDPVTGVATWIGSPATKLNGLTFSPSGILFGHGSNGAPRRSGLYKLSTQDATTIPFSYAPIPGAAETWNSSAAAAGNFADGLIYHIYRCDMATTNPSSGAQSDPVDIDNGDCPDNNLLGFSYLGDNQFLVVADRDDYEFYNFDANPDELYWDFLGSASDSIRGVVGAGASKTALAACDFEDRTFTCNIPRVIPRGRYFIDFSGDYTASKAVEVPINVTVKSAAGDQVLTQTVKVVGTELVASVSADQQRIDDGDSVSWVVAAENNGTAAAAGTTLVIQIPANQDYDDHVASSGSCSLAGRTLTCNFGTVAPGTLGQVIVYTTANADGVSTLQAEVSTTSSEGSLLDNTAEARVVVGPAADLVVSATRASSAAAPGIGSLAASKEDASITDTPGDPLGMNFVVTNLGPNSATAVTVRHVVPKNVELSAATPSKGTCNVANAILTCAVGDIAVNSTVTISLSPTAVSAGTYSFTVSAESTSTPDFNLANNSTVLSVGVLPPTLKIAAGPKNPSDGAEIGGINSPIAQVQLTHGGETQQALRVNAFKVKGTFARVLQDSIRIRAVHDVDGDGRADADERTLGEGAVGIIGETATLELNGKGIVVAPGETLTVLFVLSENVASTQTASLGGASTMAVVGLLPIAFLVGLPRRKSLQIALFLMVAIGFAGCSEDDLAVGGAKIKITLVAVDAGLAEGRGPSAPVEGLPLVGPSVEIK